MKKYAGTGVNKTVMHVHIDMFGFRNDTATVGIILYFFPVDIFVTKPLQLPEL